MYGSFKVSGSIREHPGIILDDFQVTWKKKKIGVQNGTFWLKWRLNSLQA